MMHSLRSSLVPGLLAILIMASCASYPDEQLKLAQEAMDEAQKVKAESFAAQDWESAKKAWDEGQALLAAKKYTQAGNMLLRAKSRFEKAGKIAIPLRDRCRDEVFAMQRAFNIGYSNLKSSMASAWIPASVRKDIEQASVEIYQQSEKLSREIAEEDYVEAKATSQQALKLVRETELKLQAAVKKR